MGDVALREGRIPRTLAPRDDAAFHDRIEIGVDFSSAPVSRLRVGSDDNEIAPSPGPFHGQNILLIL